MSKYIEKIRVHIARAISPQLGMFFKNKTSVVLTFFVILALALIAGWFPDGLTAYIQKDYQLATIQLSTSIVLLFFLLVFGYWTLKPGKFKVISDIPVPKKALVLFLSNLKEEDNNKIIQEIERIEGSSIDEKLNFINKGILRPWRMPLEAIKYHLSRLEKLAIITSSKSHPQVDAFKFLIEKVFGNQAEKITIKEKHLKTFENANELFTLLDEIFQELEKEGIKSKDVIVDVTSGQKINSIVGAFMTLLYDDREFQYISTNDYKVKSYDVRLITND